MIYILLPAYNEAKIQLKYLKKLKTSNVKKLITVVIVDVVLQIISLT